MSFLLTAIIVAAPLPAQQHTSEANPKPTLETNLETSKIKKMSFAEQLRSQGALTLAREQARIGTTCGDMGCG